MIRLTQRRTGCACSCFPTPVRGSLLWPLVAAFTSFWLSGFAQAPSVPAPGPNSGQHTNAQPPPPPNKSPVDLFRELWAMTPGEQRQFLADRAPENRRLLQAKLNEYKALSANERELRLRVTELRWYLLPLMQSPATNRVAQLAAVPAELRQMIHDRLRKWDQLDTQLQLEIWQNDLA